MTLQELNDTGGVGEVDRVIHEPARLKIVALLYVVASADFTFIMQQTGMTWGNLSSHVSIQDIVDSFISKKVQDIVNTF